MAENLGVGMDPRKLTIGSSFDPSRAWPDSSTFHTIRYDFKPASVDTSKESKLSIGDNGECTVTVPHVEGAVIPETVFKGSRKPCNKECVLIVNKRTGEITLERLGYNIQLKKTRSEKTASRIPPVSRPPSSVDRRNSPAERKSNPKPNAKDDLVGMSRRITQPVRPITPVDKLPKKVVNNSRKGPPAPAKRQAVKAPVQPPSPPLSAGSMPIFGMEDDAGSMTHKPKPTGVASKDSSDSDSDKDADIMSNSSNRSSSDASSSDSESEHEAPVKAPQRHMPLTGRGVLDDLQLSESDSD